MDHNVCSVPHCLVTRNFLPRWRLAAMDLFRFPPDIPMTLHICPEADRGRWIAEMDIDPNTNSKISVCSLHFKEGFPTEEFPLPSEFLSDKIEGKPLFSGANAAITDNDKTTVTEDSDSDFDNVKFTRLSAKIEKIREKRRLLMLARRAKRKRRRWIASADANDKKSSALRRKKLALDGVCGSRLQCRFCSFKVVGTKAYFHHVRKVHLGRLCNINDNNKVPEKKNEESALKDQTPPAVPTPKSSKAKVSLIQDKVSGLHLKLHLFAESQASTSQHCSRRGRGSLGHVVPAIEGKKHEPSKKVRLCSLQVTLRPLRPLPPYEKGKKFCFD